MSKTVRHTPSQVGGRYLFSFIRTIDSSICVTDPSRRFLRLFLTGRSREGDSRERDERNNLLQLQRNCHTHTHTLVFEKTIRIRNCRIWSLKLESFPKGYESYLVGRRHTSFDVVFEGLSPFR